jgi:hypothetical protein
VIQVVEVGLAISAADFEGKNLTGKICLAQRGGMSMAQKMENCTKAGATGVILMQRCVAIQCDCYMTCYISARNGRFKLHERWRHWSDIDAEVRCHSE